VLFARPIDIEVAEAGDLGVGVGETATHDLVEEEFRIAIDIQRRLVVALLTEYAATAVNRSRRRIQERNLLLGAEIHQRQRIAVVVGHHVAAVGFHGVRAGALVQDGLDAAVKLAVLDQVEEFTLVEVVGDLAIGEVAELVGLFRLSTAMMSVTPRSLSALTRFAPMKPQAPVTT
jgi:hypothetical protein